tara:strand:+ start:2383 stop:2646 length:264 start_codon:yes stop_codon:yes gene_type:complete
MVERRNIKPLGNLSGTGSNIGEHMKNKMLVRDNNGNWGHAQLIGKNERNNILVEHYEVRMLEDYDNVGIHNVASFFIYYEVMDDIEE